MLCVLYLFVILSGLDTGDVGCRRSAAIQTHPSPSPGASGEEGCTVPRDVTHVVRHHFGGGSVREMSVGRGERFLG